AICSSTVLLLYRTGIMALLCRVRLNSSTPFLMISKCRITFMPPEVEPEDAPINIKQTNRIVKKGVQAVKSAVTNPVVVTTETPWNSECLKALSPSPDTIGWKSEAGTSTLQ